MFDDTDLNRHQTIDFVMPASMRPTVTVNGVDAAVTWDGGQSLIYNPTATTQRHASMVFSTPAGHVVGSIAVAGPTSAEALASEPKGMPLLVSAGSPDTLSREIELSSVSLAFRQLIRNVGNAGLIIKSLDFVDGHPGLTIDHLTDYPGRVIPAPGTTKQ